MTRRILQKVYGDGLYIDYTGRPTDPEPPSLQARLTTFKNVVGRRPRLASRDCIHGHFKASKYDGRIPQATKVTWLRDPVERVVSHYNYWKRTPTSKHSVCRALHREGWSLLEFARHDSMRNLRAFFSTVRPSTISLSWVCRNSSMPASRSSSTPLAQSR